jgi:hypothetical protein
MRPDISLWRGDSIEELQMALDAGVTDIDAYIDSPVVAGHLLKGHRVKADHLRPLVERVRQLLHLFSTSSLARVPRALNAELGRATEEQGSVGRGRARRNSTRERAEGQAEPCCRLGLV